MSNPQGHDQPVCTRCGIHGCTWCAWSLQIEHRLATAPALSREQYDLLHAVIRRHQLSHKASS